MGDTEIFCIYQIQENGLFELIDTRINQFQDMDHAKSDKMQAILSLIKDTDILISAQMSPNFKKIAQKTELQPIVIKSDSIESALKIVTKHLNDILARVNERKQGVFQEDVPVFKA